MDGRKELHDTLTMYPVRGNNDMTTQQYLTKFLDPAGQLRQAVTYLRIGRRALI